MMIDPARLDPETVDEYPEHKRMLQIQPLSRACGEFLEWLEDEYDVHIPNYTTTTRLLAEFFLINLDRLEDEKHRMLTKLRQRNEETS